MSTRLQSAIAAVVFVVTAGVGGACAQDVAVAPSPSAAVDSSSAGPSVTAASSPATEPLSGANTADSAMQTASSPGLSPGLHRRDWASLKRTAGSTLDVVTVADTGTRHRCHVLALTATELRCRTKSGQTITYSEADVAALIAPRRSILSGIIGGSVLTAFGGSSVYGSALLFGMGGTAIVGAIPVAIIGGALGLGGVALLVALPAVRGHEHLVYTKPDILITAPMHTGAGGHK